MLEKGILEKWKEAEKRYEQESKEGWIMRRLAMMRQVQYELELKISELEFLMEQVGYKRKEVD